MTKKEYDREPIYDVARKILALSNADKAYLMGYLLISPWHSLTYKRYTAKGEGDFARNMVEWLNDRLRYLITDGKEGKKSIVSEEVLF